MSEKGKAVKVKYSKSEKGKIVQARYTNSVKGKIAMDKTKKKYLYTLLAVESHALWASQVWSPHFHWDRAMPSHSDQSRMEKSNLKTIQNPIYRYAPKADFEYPKKVMEIR